MNHDKLMHLLSKKITDRGVLALIGKYLRCGIMDHGLEQRRTKGTPQGMVQRHYWYLNML
ncbi:hypothetical protein [Sphingobacterium cavernae]|uniref:hypothetical protein n=1 Tax=Sphingobacterium cavernae TaxID=2592657 RepID=UPI0037446DC6